jgi:hypothetical protein
MSWNQLMFLNDNIRCNQLFHELTNGQNPWDPMQVANPTMAGNAQGPVED